MLELPCVSGGVAVGIGHDYLFAHRRNELHAGDVVYMLMEQAQCTTGRFATALGPNAAIRFRHDWCTSAELASGRRPSALFAFELCGALISGIEMALVAHLFHDPHGAATGSNNARGDHAGHTAALGADSQTVIAAMAVPAAAIRDGTRLIGAFVTWARMHGAQVIGWLPTTLEDDPFPAVTQAAMAAVYLEHGGTFLALPNRSGCPRSAFFDTQSHLNEGAQITHSMLLTRTLAQCLNRPPHATALVPAPRS